MCGLKAAQTHGQPFRAAKESSAAFGCTRFLFALRQKDLMFNRFIINDCCPGACVEEQVVPASSGSSLLRTSQ